MLVPGERLTKFLHWLRPAANRKWARKPKRLLHEGFSVKSPSEGQPFGHGASDFEGRPALSIVDEAKVGTTGATFH